MSEENTAPNAPKTKKPKTSKPATEKPQKPKAEKPKADSSTKGKKPEAAIRFHQKEEKIMHRFDLTDKEMRAVGVEVGNLGNQIEQLMNQAKAIANDFKSRIELKTAERDALSQKLAQQYEMRETKAIVIYDVKTQTKKFVNPRNQKDVYRGPEPMTDADRVMEMFKKKDLQKPRPLPTGEASVAAPKGPVEEAAAAQPKVELDIEEVATDLKDDVNKIIVAFRKAATAASWKGKAISGVTGEAKKLAEKGASFVVTYLKNFCIEQ